MKLVEGCVEDCPGCSYRSLSQAESDGRKRQRVVEALRLVAAPPLEGSAERWGYRRKVVLHARYGAEDWQFGLTRWREREEVFIPIPDCPVHAPWVNLLLRTLSAVLPGPLPLVFVMVSGRALTLVLKTKRQESLVETCRALWPELERVGLAALWLNWNPAAGNRVLSSAHQEQIAGAEWLRDGHLWHGPTAFRQQIAELEEAAVARAQAFLPPGKKLVDLYSGIGVSLQRWQEEGRACLGVELSGEAVRAAALNAPRVEVLRGKVGDRLPQLSAFVGEEDFVVYSNPPRSGHGPEVLAWLQQKKPRAIAYLSCNCRSLAEDLAALQTIYRVQEIQAFDFFPQTPHVEVLALLTLV